MGPCSRRTRSTISKSRKLDIYKTKKKQNILKKSRNCLNKSRDEDGQKSNTTTTTTTTTPSSPVKSHKTCSNHDSLGTNPTSFDCSTPKSEKFRIPEIKTCPPAPKKQRIMRSLCSSLKRTPVSFYATPELELLFLFGHPKKI